MEGRLAKGNNFPSLRVGSILTGLYGQKRACIEIINKVDVYEIFIPPDAIMRIPTPDTSCKGTLFTPELDRVGQSDRKQCVRNPNIGKGGVLDCVLTGIFGRSQATIHMLVAPAEFSDADIVAILNPITKSLNSCMMGSQH